MEGVPKEEPKSPLQREETENQKNEDEKPRQRGRRQGGKEKKEERKKEYAASGGRVKRLGGEAAVAVELGAAVAFLLLLFSLFFSCLTTPFVPLRFCLIFF